jgi:osmotically-inducible protein OsmY
MADNWMERRGPDEERRYGRGRDWDERQPEDRFAHEEGDYGEREPRSFGRSRSEGRWNERGGYGGRVFGEVETGGGYTPRDVRQGPGRPYRSGGPSRDGYRDAQGYGGRGYGGRYYGDTGREPIRDEDDYGESRMHQEHHTPNVREGRHEGGRGWWEKTRDEVQSWFGDHTAERRREWDHASEPGHRGRGPKGYRRSDARIQEEVCERLTADPLVDASDIEVSVSEGEVTLSGEVLDRDAKRRAERLIEDLSGVSHVQNNLRAKQREPLFPPNMTLPY